MKKSILFILTLIIFQNSFAIFVEGKIVDKETNEPIVDAVLLAISNNKLLASANSDMNGNFKIVLKKGKNIHLEVVKNGYKTERADIETTNEFINANPFIEINLIPKEAISTDEVTTEEVSKDNMEDVGELAFLPKGSKIIEAVPIKEREHRKSGFNVQAEVKDQTTNVNVKVLKEEYNKEFVTEALKPNFNFTTSYFKDGNIYYNVAKAFLSKDVKEVLKGIALRLKNDESTRLKLMVFADANKEAKIGDYISKMRMEEIVNLLIAEGVKFEQLEISVIGNIMVRNDCIEGVDCSLEQHQENRKVELTFIK